MNTTLKILFGIAVVAALVLLVGNGCLVDAQEGVVFIDNGSGLPVAFCNSHTFDMMDGKRGGLVFWNDEDTSLFEQEFCKWNRSGAQAFTLWHVIVTKTGRKWAKSQSYKDFGIYIKHLTQREDCN